MAMKHSDRRREPLVTEWSRVPVMMDVAMASVILGKNPDTLRRAILRGDFPARKVLGEWRIRKDDLMAYLGFLPWEIEKYGYGMMIDRNEQMRQEFDAGRQMMSIVG